jgi:hypothetical protein
MSAPLPFVFLWRCHVAMDDRLNANAKNVADKLSLFMSPDGTHAFPAVWKLAWLTGLCERSVRRALKQLRDEKWIRPTSPGTGGACRSTRYDAQFPGDIPEDGINPLHDADVWGARYKMLGVGRAEAYRKRRKRERERSDNPARGAWLPSDPGFTADNPARGAWLSPSERPEVSAEGNAEANNPAPQSSNPAPQSSNPAPGAPRSIQEVSPEVSLLCDFCVAKTASTQKNQNADYDFSAEADKRFEGTCERWAKVDSISSHWRVWKPKKSPFAFKHADELHKLLDEYPTASATDLMCMLGYTIYGVEKAS